MAKMWRNIDPVAAASSSLDSASEWNCYLIASRFWRDGTCQSLGVEYTIRWREPFAPKSVPQRMRL